MTMFYHGTRRTGKALKIAQSGAILSPWYQDLERLRRLKKEELDAYKKVLEHYKTSDEHEAALKLASTGYSPNELEHRVKCVSLTSELYRTRRGDMDGIALGIELDEPAQQLLFVPRQVPLDTLKEIHLESNAREQEIRAAFARYNPIIKMFDKEGRV